MGLIMFAYTQTERPEKEVDFSASPERAELHYWKRHPNLHGWIAQLYRDKDGVKEEFNCANVELTAADLDRLEADVRADTLPQIVGSFDESDGTEYEDLDFIAKAREAIAAGLTVFCTAAW